MTIGVPHPSPEPLLRLAVDGWDDPCDPTHADRSGGRWNSPGAGPTLYLNDDVATAAANVIRLHTGGRVLLEDLRDDAPYVLHPVRLDADARFRPLLSPEQLAAAGLPHSYPSDSDGQEVPHARCRPIGDSARADDDGLLVRSAAIPAGTGRETVWFPPSPEARPSPAGEPMPFSQWRDAGS